MNMDQVRTMYKISQILSNAFKQVNNICAHYLADQEIVSEQPKKVEKKTIQQKIKAKLSPAQESQPKKEIQLKKENKKQKVTSLPQKKLQPIEKTPVKNQQNKQKTDAKQHQNERKQKADHTNKPKHPLGAFFIFQQEHKENVKKLHPNASITEISKMMGQIWRGLEQNQRQPYAKQAQKLKAQYQKDLKNFYEKHPEQKSKKQLKKEKAQSKAESERNEAPVSKPAAKQATKPARKPIIIEQENSESV